jgi:hypothetical protein
MHRQDETPNEQVQKVDCICYKDERESCRLIFKASSKFLFKFFGLVRVRLHSFWICRQKPNPLQDLLSSWSLDPHGTLRNLARICAGTRSVLEFYNNLWGLGTELELGVRTGPPGCIGWRNRFLDINSWTP